MKEKDKGKKRTRFPVTHTVIRVTHTGDHNLEIEMVDLRF